METKYKECPNCGKPFITEAESKTFMEDKFRWFGRFCWLGQSLDGNYSLITRYCCSCGHANMVSLGKLGVL